MNETETLTIPIKCSNHVSVNSVEFRTPVPISLSTVEGGTQERGLQASHPLGAHLPVTEKNPPPKKKKRRERRGNDTCRMCVPWCCSKMSMAIDEDDRDRREPLEDTNIESVTQVNSSSIEFSFRSSPMIKG
ncbi:hypothetical protein CEXT_180751 [Caerostris extrusa]|uniref:Uncharacterized protein n=1 Tax=Caerostris extrusa TaxID=172846 RepID=A0AAV4MDC3_CAEEX|nr:hypothetical protein CEXT_180751 [Caerostris extrusa]